MPVLNRLSSRVQQACRMFSGNYQNRWSLPLLVSLLCLGFMGCGSGSKGPTGSVTGTVTLQSKPLGSGYIAFSSSTLGVASGSPLSATGEYKLTATLPVGDYKVTVIPPAAPPPLSAPPSAAPKSDIPEKYRSELKSDLKFSVKAGANTANFDLKP
ncbi:MAG: hypothetical protein JWN70_623 [Planctomycetaceae bacterium]|nr:hypothetical protein [Planctomycetaceae bacterium]